MKSKLPRRARFENRIRDFLKDLEFNDVGGGHNFTIDGIPVDAVGGHEKSLLIIKCTTHRKLKSKIEEFRGNLNKLEKGFSLHPKYNKYKKHHFVLATNNREIRTEDKEVSELEPPIFLWDGKLLDYYEKLYRTIGKYSKFNLLGEMKINPSRRSPMKVFALKTKIRKHKVYQFFIEPKELLEISYVARRERGLEQYYQRLVKRKRIKTLVEFLDQKTGLFPTNMVMSIVRLRFKSHKKMGAFEIGMLEFPKEYRSCWIIDGQHRLYSFAHSVSNVPIPVVAFHRLNLEQHAKFFLEINKEQKPVPPDLLWDLEGLLRPKENEGIISKTCKKLNRMRGPLNNKIYIPLHGPRKRGMLRLSGLCSSVQKAKLVEKHSAHLLPAKGTNPLYDDKPAVIERKLSSALNRYFSIIDEIFGDAYKNNFVFTAGGISVMIDLFERILSRLTKIPKKNDLKKYLIPVVKYLEDKDIKKLRDRCASWAGRAGVVNDFLITIYKETQDREILGPREPPDLGKEVITRFEPGAREFVKTILIEKFDQNWAKKIPSDILKRIEEKHGVKPPSEKVFEKLDLGDCEKIIRKNPTTLEKLLLHPKHGFDDREQLWAMYHSLKRLRDATAHGREIELKYKGEDFVRLAVDKFVKCFKEILET